MSDPGARDLGPNTWLIEEMYRQYTEDPSSVGPTWQEFFEDYTPPSGDGAGVTAQEAPAPTRAAAAPATKEASEAAPPEPDRVALRGIDATIARRMEESLGVPTATSVRSMPAKLLEVNRNILNRHLARTRGAKVSFTHLIGWAIVRAVQHQQGMNVSYEEEGGKGFAVHNAHINLGLAVDVQRDDGTRTLLVPNIKAADEMDFGRFFTSYEELIKKVQQNKLTPDDFAGTTITITNPGMIGTEMSVPRLMSGQAAIIGVGSIGYPTAYEGADPQTLAELGVGKVVTITSTYDHRVIQGAESGRFLARVHDLLLGVDDFYDEVFAAMHVPYVPVRWLTDDNPEEESVEAEEKQARVLQLINAYRVRGHLIAPLDPLEMEPPSIHPELDPATYGFTIWDLDREFVTGGLAGVKQATLGDILALLRDAYCRSATVEYMHIQEPDQKAWIQSRVEGISIDLEPDDRRHILTKLNQAEAFERFLHTKYVGHKRFSLEGAESLVPVLDAVLDRAADDGIEEVVAGLTHRGRLNILANVVGKSYAQIFREFEGDIDPEAPQGSGDVKYHMGAGGTHRARSGAEVRLTVASNPSHLEAVDPVVEGIVRAKQDLLDRGLEYPVLPVLVHGDAAFAGQGVVAETLNLSQLPGYRTGGTIHVIVNNQVGFTTGQREARSSTYASDVARMIQAPIFHVNGDDPEACVRVARLAFDFRQTFHKDVVIDMLCYRRWGHNEGDDPSITQPLMYSIISKRRSVRKLYTEALVNRGDMTLEEAEGVLEEFQGELQSAFTQTREPSETPAISWKLSAPIAHLPPVPTGVERERLDTVLRALTSLPDGFSVHKKLRKWLDERAAALDADAADWALGETLAFGSLLLEGTTVRLVGEDTRRGTFNQRHAVYVDPNDAREYTPLAGLSDRAKFFCYDSLLSEFATVGFEYGYSVANQDALVMWEAQFGDFVNGAQVITDQFIVAAEDKWGQTCRLVLLLPHGYEGQGPEHSSARLERFLVLAAEDNLQIVVPSTPAQYFHAIRRQMHREIPKPMVVLTPKSLLRLPAARSATSSFTDGHFQEVLVDQDAPEDVSRVLLCQGKLAYELAAARAEQGVRGAAIVRVEQVYPFPTEQLRAALASYGDAEVYWVQEEPENMGAWGFMHLNTERRLDIGLRVVAREESPSPATGSQRVHQREQGLLIRQAFDGLKSDA